MIIPNCYTCHKNPGLEYLWKPDGDSIFLEPICKECREKIKQ